MGYNGLTNHHIQALDLLKTGKFTYNEIATQVGVHIDTLRGWVNGDANAGPTAALFSAEWHKIRKQVDEETIASMRTIQRSLSEKLSKWSETVLPTTLQEVKAMRAVLATVADAQKSDIDVTQIFNYSNNVEDIVSEARRLHTIADAALGRQSNQSFKPTGQSKVPGELEARDQVVEAVQSAAISAEPEAGSVPPEQSPSKGSVRGKQKR